MKSINNKAQRILEYAYKNPDDRIGLVARYFRHVRSTFDNIEKLLIEKDQQPNIKRWGSHWEIQSPFRIVAVPLGYGKGICGYRFQAIFVDDMSLLSKQQIDECIIPHLSIRFNPITHPNQPKPILVDLSHE